MLIKLLQNADDDVLSDLVTDKWVISVLNGAIKYLIHNKTKVSLLTYSTPQKMTGANVRAACLQPPPLESKRTISGAAAGPLSPLSGYWKLHQQMSKKGMPLSKWEESFHHRLLNRGAVPNSQFTIICFLRNLSTVSWCMSPTKTDPLFGNYISPCIPLVWWFNEFPCANATLQRGPSGPDNTVRGEEFHVRNRQTLFNSFTQMAAEIKVEFLDL